METDQISTADALLDVDKMNFGAWLRLAGDLSKEAWFFNSTLLQFGHNLLSKFYGSDVWRWDENTLLAKCRQDKWLGENGDYSDADAFFKEVLSVFLHLEKLPRDAWFDISQRVHALIKDLVFRKKTYEDQCHALEGIKNRNGVEEYKLRLLRYYHRRVTSVLDDACTYVAEELNADALEHCKIRWIGLGSVGRIEVLEAQATSADMERCNDVENKFLEYPAWRVDELQQMYKDDPVEFYKWAEKELREKLIPDARSLFGSNHLLYVRQEILEEGVSQYQSGKYQVASSILALQIEGLIRDVLVLLGEDEEKMYSSSITEKAEKLDKHETGFYAYEYYAFRFPVFRNEIAHGDAHKTQREDCIKLMLDFCALCRYVARDEKIPTNHIIELIEKATEGNCDVKTIVEYATYSVANKDVTLPDFYNLKAKVDGVRNRIASVQFWDDWYALVDKGEYDPQQAIKDGAGVAAHFNVHPMFETFKQKCVAKIHSSEAALNKKIQALKNLFGT